MSTQVMTPSRKKKRVRFAKESPFPIPVSSITGEPVAPDHWFYYTGYLRGQSVIIQHSGDISFLYKMGFFGKGNLSRSQPDSSKRFPSARIPVPGSTDRFIQARVMSRRLYKRHAKWNQLESCEGVSANSDDGYTDEEMEEFTELKQNKNSDNVDLGIESSVSQQSDYTKLVENSAVDTVTDAGQDIGAELNDESENDASWEEEDMEGVWGMGGCKDERTDAEKSWDLSTGDQDFWAMKSEVQSKETEFYLTSNIPEQRSNIVTSLKYDTDVAEPKNDPVCDVLHHNSKCQTNIIASVKNTTSCKQTESELPDKCVMHDDDDKADTIICTGHSSPAKQIMIHDNDEADTIICTGHSSPAKQIMMHDDDEADTIICTGHSSPAKQIMIHDNDEADTIICTGHSSPAKQIMMHDDDEADTIICTGHSSPAKQIMIHDNDEADTIICTGHSSPAKQIMMHDDDEADTIICTGHSSPAKQNDNENVTSNNNTLNIQSNENIDRQSDRHFTQNINNSKKHEVEKQQFVYAVNSGCLEDITGNDQSEVLSFDIQCFDEADGDMLVINDSDNENKEQLQHCKLQKPKWRPVLKRDLYPIVEHLQLSLEEAFFLTYGLGCLVVKNESQEHLSVCDLWSNFCEVQKTFLPNYVAYHHFRSKGWVPKSGLKFGSDFILYREGPPFYHGSYSVIVRLVDEETLQDSTYHNPRSLSWTSLSGLNRITEHVAKELLMCYVIKPRDITPKRLTSPKCIPEFSVQEVHVSRWISSQEREKKEVEEFP